MRRLTGTGIAAVLWLAALMSGCGDSDDLVIGVTPTFTATRTAARRGRLTRTAAPTVTPTSVQGPRSLASWWSTRTSAPPARTAVTQLPPGGSRRSARASIAASGGADWVADDGDVRGATDEDGRFTVTGLTLAATRCGSPRRWTAT
jgi:hypothetical protein